MNTTLAVKAYDSHRGLDLFVSGEYIPVRSGNVLSPFYQLKHCPTTEGRFEMIETWPMPTDRDSNLSLNIMVTKAVASAIGPYNQDLGVDVLFYDGNTYVNEYVVEMPDVSKYTSPAAIQTYAAQCILAYAATQGYTNIATAADIMWDNQALFSMNDPASYQTVVSQTGTAAPAVGSGFTPINSYSGAPTFTWARTGTGVYTLTASSAIFSTTGKTTVLLGSLNNLNGAWKAVVTSSTVITLTTAVQSLATLGLLGFTATPTDALLANTAVYVQTYS